MKLYLDIESFDKICNNQADIFYKEITSAITNEATTIFCFSKERLFEKSCYEAFVKAYFPYIPAKKRFFDDQLEAEIEGLRIDKIHESILFNRNLKNENCASLNGILAGNSEDIEKIFFKLFLSRRKKDFDRLYTLGEDFQCWNDIRETFSPLNDIIILDPYCLDQEDSLLELNLINLLVEMTINQKNVVNIVFFTLDSKLRGRDHSELIRNITQKLKRQNNCTANVTLVTIKGNDPKAVKSLEEHDRCVATNYFSIIPGNSLVFINADASILNNSRFLEVKSHFKNENQKYFGYIIESVQNVIDLKMTKPGNIRIEGAKKSNYLRF